MRGLFITVEGIEGTGKTTQVPLLSNALRERGVSTLNVREPGGTAVGDAIREIFFNCFETLQPATEVGLLVASKNQLLQEKILPALEAGTTVICDRYTDTLFAYQCGGKQLPEKLVRDLLTASDCNVEPDIRFYLRLTVEQSQERLRARSGLGGELNVLDLQSTAFHRRVYDHFEQRFARHSGKVIVIDGTQSIEAISQQMFDAVIHHYCNDQSEQIHA